MTQIFITSVNFSLSQLVSNEGQKDMFLSQLKINAFVKASFKVSLKVSFNASCYKVFLNM